MAPFIFIGQKGERHESGIFAGLQGRGHAPAQAGADHSDGGRRPVSLHLKTMPDYDFYSSVYHGGAIPAEDWPAYEERAAAQMVRYRRMYTVTAPGPDSGAMAVCAMAEALYGFDLLLNGGGGPVQSASIGSVSVSYANAAQGVDLTPKGQARELYRCASRYLDIYRGVG